MFQPLKAVKRYPRIDGYERVTGIARYTADWKMPHMLYGRVLLSNFSHGKITAVDTGKATSTPGVKAVLTCMDTNIRWGPGDRFNNRLVFDRHVRFVGETIAAVAAVTREIVQEAVETIQVDYEELPANYDSLKSLTPEVSPLWPNGNLHYNPKYERGDVVQGFKNAYRTFQATYTTARFHNAPLEIAASLAWWEGDKLTVVSGTQGITNCRKDLASDLDLPLNKVRILSFYKGGGFGNKNNDMNYDIIAALLAKKTAKPVLLEYDRRQDFQGVHGRWASIQNLKAGVSNDGRLTALQLDAVVDVGAYGRHPSEYIVGPRAYYDCANVKMDIQCVYTNLPATGNMRAPTGVAGCFATESLMDEIASEMNIDPVQFRLMNRTVKHDGHGDYTSCGLEDCIRLGAELIGWKDKWIPPTAKTGTTRTGLGMAMASWHSMLGMGAALIRVNKDATAQLYVGVTDIGTGAKTTMAIIAAETLGIPLKDIGVTWGDTDVCPYSVGESGSRTTTQTGLAVKAAAEDAKQQLLSNAASLLDARTQDLQIENREIHVKGDPSRSIPASKAAEITPDAIVGRGLTDPKLPPHAGRESFGAHFIEVEVDVEVGTVKPTRYIAVHDSGPIVNYAAAESQVHGSVIMGLGMALTEEEVFDYNSGMMCNSDFWTYKIPTHEVTPKIEVTFLDIQDPYGPKSGGEIGTVPVAPAVANAIYNAVGARLREMPMTPERILKAIEKIHSPLH